MTTLIVLGLIAAAYGIGRCQQFIRDARGVMGAHTRDRRSK